MTTRAEAAKWRAEYARWREIDARERTVATLPDGKGRQFTFARHNLPNHKRHDAVCELASRGWNYQQIGKILHLSPARISQIAFKAKQRGDFPQ